MRKIYLASCLILIALVGDVNARMMNDPGDNVDPSAECDECSCDDELNEYEGKVKKCLDAATTLEDARKCSEPK